MPDMGHPQDREILKPVSQVAKALGTPPSGASRLVYGNISDTPAPAVPDLSWGDTPPTKNGPLTPKGDFDFDAGDSLPLSPLAARKAGTKARKLAASNTSLLGLDDDLLENQGLGSNYLLASGYVPQSHTSLVERKRVVLNAQHGTEQSKSSVKTESCEVVYTATSPGGPPSSRHHAAAYSVSQIKIEAEDSSVHPRAVEASCLSLEKTSERQVGLGTNAPTVSATISATSVKAESTLLKPDVGVVSEAKPEVTGATLTTESSPNPSTSKFSVALVWGLSKTLSQILPLEAVARLKSSPRQCVATTQKDKRCCNPNSAKLTEDMVADLLKQISPLKRPFEVSVVAKHIRALVAQATCLHTHQRTAKKYLESLCSYSWEINEITDRDPHEAKAIANMAASVFQLWLESLMKTPTEPEGTIKPINEDTCVVQKTLASTIDLIKVMATMEDITLHHPDPAVAATSDYDNSRVVTTFTKTSRIKQAAKVLGSVVSGTHLNHNFEKYVWPKSKINLTVQELIRQTLVRPLTSADMDRSGFIYIFWHPPSFGYVKIGYSKDVNRRLRTWERKCGFTVDQHSQEDRGLVLRVNHLHRVESLIHAELKDDRVCEPRCPGCGGSHIEWFHVSPAHALKVVAKWTSVSLYSGGVLKQGVDVAELCKVIEDGEAMKPPLTKKPAKSLPKHPTRGGRRSQRISLKQTPAVG
ncbi:uncharacterized protein A1O9_00583 [Exophiala aquamarina CBS 119918]|uniref:Bacteriophage T5 Orf172 DNA-binding domain-containing protein n=1 Tax=Exophiala aquamarina CBS 119918 TaxID=1182545 RepID=A0A072Q3X2_9EURO|nr:uncharacterized protein A1O9_00583 [Exophiala aquamarina CBS 119918]KEF62610.1 hypothetical protein A1O9_00583 [Exophiala aquamarina CBS 119918]